MIQLQIFLRAFHLNDFDSETLGKDHNIIVYKYL